MTKARMPRETEKGFTKAVIELAQLHSWHVAHFRPAMTQAGKWITAVQGNGKGYPDLTLCRGPRLIFAELKTDVGKPTPEQTEWLLKLAGAGAECYIWRPKHWAEIERTLAGI